MRAAPTSRVLAAIACSLGGAVLFEIFLHEGGMRPATARDAPGPATRASVVPGSMAAQPIESAVGTILARPLFSVNRHPPDHAGAAGPTQAAAQTGAHLLGTLVIGQSRYALFEVDGSPRAVVIAPGGTVAGLTVAKVDPGRVKVSGKDGTQILVPVHEAAAPSLSADTNDDNSSSEDDN